MDIVLILIGGLIGLALLWVVIFTAVRAAITPAKAKPVTAQAAPAQAWFNQPPSAG